MIATGAGTDSNININGSNLNVTNDALFQADNDLTINGVAQNSNTRSDNKSSSTAIGAYAATNPGKDASYGITASASHAKGYANSDSTTYANSQVNVGGNTTLDIGNDLNIKGGVLNTDKIQGVIGGDMTIESLQDTATYNSDQKNMGFSADLDLAKGTGSSLSVNGGKTNVNADSKIVNEQSGIFSNEADLTANGKGSFTGAVFTTSKEAQTNGKSNIVFKQGVSSQDVKNTTSYEGEALSIGLSIGNTTGKPQATMNGIGYGTDSDSDSSITKGGVSGYNDPQGMLTTEKREALGGKLESVFDANRVNEELGAQTQITQEFGKEAPKAVAEFSQNRIDAIKDDTTLSIDEKLEAIKKWDEGGIYRVAAHTALGALGTGSVEGALTTGSMAAAPTLDNLQKKISDALVANGMSEDIAKGTANGVISLALLGTGSAVGLDTSSIVAAMNVDANNRQLHPQEKELAKVLFEKAKKQGWKRADGKSYTLQEIEDALRWANSTKYNDDVTIIVGNNAKGVAIGQVLIKMGNGDTGRAIIKSYEDLASGDPAKVKKAQATQIQIFTSLGLSVRVDGNGTPIPIKKTSSTSASKYSTSTTQAAQRAGSNHPLLEDAIPRNGSRLIVNQGQCPTCGPNSAKMVLDTLGKNVPIEKLIKKSPMTADGIYYTDVRNLLKSQGVDAVALPNRTVNDIARYTAKGTPVIVQIAGKNGFPHFVVVDGITKRYGKSVVAIRDPNNIQYFSPINTFESSFTGNTVIIRSK